MRNVLRALNSDFQEPAERTPVRIAEIHSDPDCEIDKIASNISIGRNFAGVHWRWDHNESLKLGERVAQEFLKETVGTYNEDARFAFSGFDDTTYNIHK